MRTTHALRGIAAAGALALASVLGGCSTNPATGEQMVTLMSWDQERSLAAEAAPQFTEEFGGETPDASVQSYVDEIGGTLTRSALAQAYAEVPDLEWEYTLLDSAVLNAFALPGGKVYISRGLADKLNNEAQLAGVLGHEVGHVMARHGNQRITKQLGFNLAMTALAAGVGVADSDSAIGQYGRYAVPAIAVGGNVVMLSYGRNEELEADTLGIQYMVDGGWDPTGQLQVMQILGAASQGNAPPEWLSTHPASETRVDRIRKLIRAEYAFTQNNPSYELDPETYSRRMLQPLDRLPPPRQGTSQAMGASFDLAEPALWCAHCAEGETVAAAR